MESFRMTKANKTCFKVEHNLFEHGKFTIWKIDFFFQSFVKFIASFIVCYQKIRFF